MKKNLLLLAFLSFSLQLKAWWDPGHLVTAMIAYKLLDKDVQKKVDKFVKILRRDYKYINHFVALAAWPDDLKAEEVRCYNSMHYTDIPYNPHGVALPPRPEIDVLWSIRQATSVLKSKKARDIEKARQLAFLMHFVGDIHQPLHSTSMFTNSHPGGDAGGNFYRLAGEWSNLHKLWDDGCGYLSAYNDINPYGKPKEPLSKTELDRLDKLASELMAAYPEESLPGVDNLDPDFWALESHKLAIDYAYRGVVSMEGDRKKRLKPKTVPSEYYKKQGQEVVRKQLALAGYRMAKMLNQVFGAVQD